MKFLLNLFLLLFHAFSGVVHANDDSSQLTTFVGFTLSKVTLTQVAKKFRETESIATVDGGDYEVALRYKTKSGFIHFLSGEMGGGVDLIGVGTSKDQVYETCSKPLDPKSLLKLPLAGINIGMSKVEFVHATNSKVEWNGNVGLAFLDINRPMTKNKIDSKPADMQDAVETHKAQNYFDISISVMGTFKENILTNFNIWKVESI
jgi:hypothetical protein